MKPLARGAVPLLITALCASVANADDKAMSTPNALAYPTTRTVARHPKKVK